jgi:hypothetical protein
VALNVDAIAERRLELRSSGPTVEVVVKIGRPELDESHDAWKCAYEIEIGDASQGRDKVPSSYVGVRAAQLNR